MYEKAINVLKKNEGNIEVGNYLYQVALAIYLLINFLSATVIDIPENLTFYISTLSSILIMIKVMIVDDNKWSYKMNFILIIIIMYITGRYAGDFSFYYYSYFIVGALNVKFNDILKTFLLTVGGSLVLIVISTSMGIIPNIEIGRKNGATLRYAMGTIFPTDTAARVFYLMLAYSMLKKFKLNIPEYISYVSITAITYFVTDTKLDMILMIMLILCSLVRKKLEEIFSIIKPIYLKVLGLIFIFGNIFLAYIYSPKIAVLTKLNSILTGRLFYGHIAFKNYNVTMFGQYIYQNGWGGLNKKVVNYFFIDSSYVRLLMMFGVITFLLVMMLLIKMIDKFIKYQAYTLILGLIFVVISSSIDQHLVELSYNVIFLTMFSNISYFRKK